MPSIPAFAGMTKKGYREAVPKPPPFENNPFLHCSAVVQTAGRNASHRLAPAAACRQLPRLHSRALAAAARRWLDARNAGAFHPRARSHGFGGKGRKGRRDGPRVGLSPPRQPPARPALPPHGIARFRWGARISTASRWIARSTALRPFAFSRAERSTSAAVPTWRLSMPPCAAKQSGPVPPRRQRRQNDGARPSLLSH